jgi:tetratricopeptide (TPR) repeat protein
MDKKSRDFVMGKLYLKNKDYKMAEKSFSEYLSSNPEDFQALKMLAQVQEHLNDTAKAFDLYQRCYLSQPDRKGVLLDICRLLLVNDPRLDHVDQKKWLKLAVQAFPTNPIVTNLRESLPSSQDSQPGRITTEDMIMEKLTFLEDRFKNLEDRFENLEERFKGFEDGFKSFSDGFKDMGEGLKMCSEKLKTLNDSFRTFDERFAKLENKLTNSSSEQQVQAAVVPERPKLVSSPSPAIFGASTNFKPSASKPLSFTEFQTKPLNQQENIDDKLKDLSIKPVDFGAFKPASTVPSTTVPPPSNSTSVFGSLSFSPAKLDSTKLSNDTNVNSSFNANATANATANAGAFKFDGVNLFAESLKKMNLPTEGLWGSKPSPKKDEPKEENNEEDGNDDDDGAVVATEELPIENTCDMRPIEIKTGEEDEDVVFKHRCKLYRFRDKEYKERGVGDIKILKHKETGKGRLIMRRDLVNLVCLNCWSCENIERMRDTQVRFSGVDASDSDPTMTLFLVKFKLQDTTDEFMKHLKDLFTES